MSNVDTIIVLAGGDAPRSGIQLPPASHVIAADSGLELAEPLGLRVDLVIGDMDSVDADVLASAEAAGVTVKRFPTDKDATDLELALDVAAARQPDHIVVVGGGGGRLDHLLANAALLSVDRGFGISWHTGDYVVVAVRDHLVLHGAPGDLITILATDAVVSTDGLRWPLQAETLVAGSTRGVSNELEASQASVTVHQGMAMVLHRRTT